MIEKGITDGGRFVGITKAYTPLPKFIVGTMPFIVIEVSRPFPKGIDGMIPFIVTEALGTGFPSVSV